MIRKSYPWLLLLAGVVTGLVISGRLVLLAQDRAGARRSNPSRPAENGVTVGSPRPVSPPGVEEPLTSQPGAEGSSSAPRVQDLLLRPYGFSFSRPTSLRKVCSHLNQTLNVPVVLDLAALD